MFGIGFPELIIIGIIALLVFGPNKLPDLAKALAKGLQEFKKATQEMKENLNIDENLKQDLKGIKENLDDSLREIKAEITDSVTDFNRALATEAKSPQDTSASAVAETPQGAGEIHVQETSSTIQTEAVEEPKESPGTTPDTDPTASADSTVKGDTQAPEGAPSKEASGSATDPQETAKKGDGI